MRIFVTGGTGYIGSAVVRALVKAGHEVTGLVRSQENAERLTSLGAKPLRGDIKDASTYTSVATEHDALVNMAFEYGPEAVNASRTAAETLVSAAKAGGGERVVVFTSGVMVLGNTGDGPANEDASTEGAAEAVAWRPGHEKLVLDGATDSVATAVIRPGMVYGGKAGLIAQYFGSALNDGAVTYLGDGANRWCMVHRNDLAELYRLVAEKRARGIFHGVDGAAITVADVARAASDAAGKAGATQSLSLEEARKEMGAFADALCLDQVVGARRSIELGWAPTHAPFPQSARAAFHEWKA